jgi:hypothetical protein
MAASIGVPLYEVIKIERGDADRYVSFDGYLRYADYLGNTLKEVFLESAAQDRDAASTTHGTLSTVPRERQSQHEDYESIVLEHVQEVIGNIIACGEKATMMVISRHMRSMHMPFQLLRHYASVNTIVEQLLLDGRNERQNERKKRTHQRENDLMDRVESVVAMWHRSERVITQREIADSLGISMAQLYYYPRVRAIVQQHPSHRPGARTRPHQEHVIE